MKLSELVGARLRETREARGMSQAELARRSGVAQSTLSRYEREDVHDPGLNTLLSLAKCLHVTVDDQIDDAAPQAQLQAPPPMGQTMAGREGVIETALLGAFDKGQHTFGDVDAVRTMLRESAGDVSSAARVRVLLDAAARVRQDGMRVDPGSIALEVARRLGAQ